MGTVFADLARGDVPIGAWGYESPWARTEAVMYRVDVEGGAHAAAEPRAMHEPYLGGRGGLGGSQARLPHNVSAGFRIPRQRGTTALCGSDRPLGQGVMSLGHDRAETLSVATCTHSDSTTAQAEA
jgi:hypothetical protein